MLRWKGIRRRDRGGSRWCRPAARRPGRFRRPVRSAGRGRDRARAPRPSDRRAPTSTGIRARSLPSAIFTATLRPSGSAAQCTPSAPPLTSRPSTACMRRVSSTPVPPTMCGYSRMASVTTRSADPGAGGRQRAERASQSHQRRRVDRCAAAVDPDAGRRLAGGCLDHRPDPLLQRMIDVEIARRRPGLDPAGGQHRRVLARAVHVRPPRPAVAANDRPVRGGIAGQRLRAAEVLLGETGSAENVQGAVNVLGLAGVRRGGQRQVSPDERRVQAPPWRSPERASRTTGGTPGGARHRAGRSPSRHGRGSPAIHNASSRESRIGSCGPAPRVEGRPAGRWSPRSAPASSGHETPQGLSSCSAAVDDGGGGEQLVDLRAGEQAAVLHDLGDAATAEQRLLRDVASQSPSRNPNASARTGMCSRYC